APTAGSGAEAAGRRSRCGPCRTGRRPPPAGRTSAAARPAPWAACETGARCCPTAGPSDRWDSASVHSCGERYHDRTEARRPVSRRPLNSIVFSNDGSLFATAAGLYGVRIYDVATRRLVHRVCFPDYVGHIALSSDGKILAGCTKKGISLWGLALAKEVGRITDRCAEKFNFLTGPLWREKPRNLPEEPPILHHRWSEKTFNYSAQRSVVRAIVGWLMRECIG